MAKTKKIKSKTVQTRNALRVTNAVMFGAKFVIPFVPMTVMTIINWDEWFAKTQGGLPAGFAALLVSTLIAVIGVMKRDELVKRHISQLFVFALAMLVAGAACFWLADVMNQAGMMFMLTGAAVFTAAIDDQVLQSYVSTQLEEYNEYVRDGGLDKKAIKKEERRKRAMEEMAEARKRAVE